MPPMKPKFQKVSGDLNVVLSDKQITSILKQVLGPTGSKIPGVALVSDACCVDASVASSVAGPVSGVASSVSIPGMPGLQAAKSLKAKVSEKEIKIKVKTPKNLKVK